MNFERLVDDWRDLKARIRANWDKLTDADMAKLDTGMSAFAAALQERYGWTAEKASEDLERFLARVRSSVADAAASCRDAAEEAWQSGASRVRDSVQSGRERLAQEWEKRAEQASACSDRVETMIQQRPFVSIACAAGVGALLGFLWRRR